MLRKLAISGAALLAACGVAFAADLPTTKGPPPAPPAPAPVFTWTGLYFGGHVGVAGATDGVVDVDHLNGGAHYSMNPTDVIGGGQIGYNWQMGNFVFGLEGDGGYLDLTAKKFDPNFPGGTFTRLLPGAYGDVTGRIGFAFDRALLYAKGGWAGFGGEGSVNNTKGNFGGGEAYSNSFSGWTIGGGLEYMFAPNWSGKIEYQHFDFGTQTALLVTPAFGNFRYTHDLTADAVTVGLNFYLH